MHAGIQPHWEPLKGVQRGGLRAASASPHLTRLPVLDYSGVIAILQLTLSPVSCSAGIGRTGVLITMETAMCLMECSQPVYPLDIVRTMRDQRAMMIQTPVRSSLPAHHMVLNMSLKGAVYPRSERGLFGEGL